METDEEFLDRRERARFRADARAEVRLDRQHNAAEALVGQLCREEKTIYYINVRSKQGRLTGATREFSHEYDARNFLIRNRYV